MKLLPAVNDLLWRLAVHGSWILKFDDDAKEDEDNNRWIEFFKDNDPVTPALFLPLVTGIPFLHLQSSLS